MHNSTGSSPRLDWQLEVPIGRLSLARDVARFPYVPSDPATLDARCEEVYQIQIQGLVRRLEATGVRKPVIGVSGGLDSAHPLLVAAKAMDRLGLPRSNILAFTLPGLSTGQRTRRNATELMRGLGVSAQDIDHPYARGRSSI